MNLLSAVVLFPILFRLGVPFAEPLIGKVDVGSPAWVAGLETGDRVISVDGDPVFKFDDIGTYTALSSPGVGLDVEVERRGEHQTIHVVPRIDESRGMLTMGVLPLAELDVDPDSEAYRRGLRTGDIPVSLNGEPIDGYKFQEPLPPFPDPVTLGLLRGDEHVEVELQPGVVESKVHRLGVLALRNKLLAVRGGGFDSLRDGDIVEVANGRPVYDPEGFRAVVEAAGPGGTVSLQVTREGEPRALVLAVPNDRPLDGWLENMAWGSDFDNRVVPVEGAPAAVAGIQPGDRIVRGGGMRINDYSDIQKMMSDFDGKGALDLEVMRDGASLGITVEPDLWTHASLGFDLRYRTYLLRKSNVLDACRAGFQNTAIEFARVFSVLHRMIFTRSVSPKNLGGPVTIVATLYRFAEIGFTKLLYIVALLSINLAVFNLLPIPVLDGGQLLFLLIEKVKGSPVNERVMGLFQWAGLLLIIALLLFVTFQDIRREL
jgi:regulator of sigma E protease